MDFTTVLKSAPVASTVRLAAAIAVLPAAIWNDLWTWSDTQVWVD